MTLKRGGFFYNKLEYFFYLHLELNCTLIAGLFLDKGKGSNIKTVHKLENKHMFIRTRVKKSRFYKYIFIYNSNKAETDFCPPYFALSS